MVNVGNIDRMIEVISAQPEPIHMSDWVIKNGNKSECGTAACLAGWANLLRLGEIGSGKTSKNDLTLELEDTGSAAEWMGIDGYYADRLFYTTRADILKPQYRKEAAIKLLTRIRNGETPRWGEILATYEDESGRIKPEYADY